MLRVCTAASLLALLMAAQVSAQEWADKLFSTKIHNFGVVARNAKTEFTFEMENPFAADVHIAGVRTSCGCTTPRILKADLTTYEKSGILAVFNTDSFLGHRGATITVIIDKPRFAEVQLRVDGEIRGDVTLQPGELAFGKTDVGAVAERKLLVQYNGSNGNWRIEQVQCANPHLLCRLQLVKLSDGRNVYELAASLSADTPAGYLTDQLVLVTNDPSAPRLPVSISGRVTPPLTLSPASLFLGVVRPAQEVQRKLVVIGSEPFRVLDIECEANIRFEASETAQKVHVIPLTFTAGDAPGKLVATIKVRTDLQGGTDVECTASAAIVAPTE
jgi:hypothetical protein